MKVGSWWSRWLVQRMAAHEERVPALHDSKRMVAATSEQILVLALKQRRGKVHRLAHSDRLDVDMFRQPGESDQWRHQSEFQEWVNSPSELHLVLGLIRRLGAASKDHALASAYHHGGRWQPAWR